MIEKVVPGCWLQTSHGPAVCTHISEERSGVPPEGAAGQPAEIQRFYCRYRYVAVRPGAEDDTWAELNGQYLAEAETDPEHFVRFAGRPDEAAQRVLALRCPYTD